MQILIVHMKYRIEKSPILSLFANLKLSFLVHTLKVKKCENVENVFFHSFTTKIMLICNVCITCSNERVYAMALKGHNIFTVTRTKCHIFLRHQAIASYRGMCHSYSIMCSMYSTALNVNYKPCLHSLHINYMHRIYLCP